jgi:hypothetical protein
MCKRPDMRSWVVWGYEVTWDLDPGLRDRGVIYPLRNCIHCCRELWDGGGNFAAD